MTCNTESMDPTSQENRKLDMKGWYETCLRANYASSSRFSSAMNESMHQADLSDTLLLLCPQGKTEDRCALIFMHASHPGLAFSAWL